MSLPNRTLLLHSDDGIPPSGIQGWSLIVDLGRAPANTYERWSQQAGCRVSSLFDFSEGTNDLRRTRDLLELGMGKVVDRFGIDWWDVLVQSIVPELQQLICLGRLEAMIDPGSEIVCTRPHFLATALQKMVRGKLTILETSSRRLVCSARHYLRTLQQLDSAQLAQVIQDKFDSGHKIRRRFARSRISPSGQLVLLPSAYVNVSRTAVAYAEMLPDVNFLLLSARNSGRLSELPPNVTHESLDGYFSGADQKEAHSWKQDFHRLRQQLLASAAEYEMAEASGLLERLETRLPWGLAVRDAWGSVFKNLTITACLCADDSNPYSRLPLIIAKSHGIPALACHHGALDSRMAIKKQHADFYLAKSEMERDYLGRVCQVPQDKVVTFSPTGEFRNRQEEKPASSGWMVFFSEPYQVAGWRIEEIYRALLPRLATLAHECELELVFKLHPFESVAGHRNILRRHLNHETARAAQIITGPIPSLLWRHIRCGLTVQSTVAVECTAHNVPVFLLGWLADSTAGYVQQYERFGVGYVLRSPAEMEEIPQRIDSLETEKSRDALPEATPPQMLHRLLTGSYSVSALASAWTGLMESADLLRPLTRSGVNG
jgi:hypothetical protein